MKKILLLIFCSIGFVSSAQNVGFFFLNPSLRMGAIVPKHIGNSAMQQYSSTPVGIDVNYTLLKVYKAELNMGYSGASYRFQTQSNFTPIDRTTQSIWYVQLGYGLDLKKNWRVTPYISLGTDQLRHRNNGVLQATQNGTQVQIGSYIDFTFAKLVSVYSGLSFSTTQYNLQEGVSPYVTKFKDAQALLFTLGIKLN